MKRTLAWLVVASLLSSSLVAPGTAEAQRRRRDRAASAETLDPFDAAERAYLEVDFERTLEHASMALQSGGHSPERLSRIYELLGVSAAALGDPDGARSFFQRMLAIDANATLDDSVPPRLRAPYLEARGEITASSDSLDAVVRLDRARSQVHVDLTDPFELARTVRVHVRLANTLDYTSTEAASTDDIVLPLPGLESADRVEYWIEILDAYGNQAALVGSAIEPRSVGRVNLGGAGPAIGTPTPTPDEGGSSVLEDPLFWIIAGGAALVIGGVVAGILVDEASHVPVRTGVTFGMQ